jgi:hypothetical protein
MLTLDILILDVLTLYVLTLVMLKIKKWHTYQCTEMVEFNNW